jgi:hypothetical protein
MLFVGLANLSFRPVSLDMLLASQLNYIFGSVNIQRISFPSEADVTNIMYHIVTIWGRDYKTGFGLDDLIYCNLIDITRSYK